MKNLCYLLLLISINSSAQGISGLYSGTLTNDSLKMIQNYELALSEYRGKITGFSYITFVANDTFYYGIKRIKATRVKGELVVEDVEMLMNNYPQKADKGVHLINKIPLPQSDTITNLNGRWETTRTKKFYSISGDMSLKKDDDSTHSPLMAHLKELKIIDYQDEKKELNSIAKTEQKQKPAEVKATSKANKPEQKEVAFKETKPNETVAKESVTAIPVSQTVSKTVAPEKPAVQQSKPLVVDAQQKDIASKETKPNQGVPIENKTAPNSSNTQVNNVAIKPKTTEPARTDMTASTAVQKTEPTEKPKEVKQVASVENQSREKSTAITQTVAVTAQPKNTITNPATLSAFPSPIEKRINNTIQTVTVASDSLVLSFYDNGVVDGDSISVYLNGENVISKVKLKEAAVKKTIYLNNQNANEMRLTLVAENLGSIPPNTGLLIIQDGSDKYQIRFSADMETNASVIIQKKNK